MTSPVRRPVAELLAHSVRRGVRRSPCPIPGCRFVRVYQLMCTGYRRDALPCASTRACTSAHHGANHLSPHRRMAMLLVWLRWRPLRVGSCMQVCKCSPRRQGTHGHLMAMLLVWLRGELWDQHGAPLALPLGLGSVWGTLGSTRRSLGSATGAGLCGELWVHARAPCPSQDCIRDYGLVLAPCGRGVVPCLCGDYRVVPCQWGLRSCPTRGWWCLVRRCRCLATASPAHATRTGSGNPWRMIDVFSRVFSVQ